MPIVARRLPTPRERTLPKPSISLYVLSRKQGGTLRGRRVVYRLPFTSPIPLSQLTRKKSTRLLQRKILCGELLTREKHQTTNSRSSCLTIDAPQMSNVYPLHSLVHKAPEVGYRRRTFGVRRFFPRQDSAKLGFGVLRRRNI